MSEPKRHHFIPKFYLNYFADKDGMIWVFDRVKKECRYQSIKDTAVINDFYTLIDEEGKKDFKLEKLISNIESNTKPIIEKLSKKQGLNIDEKKTFALFISLLKNRTTEFDKMMNELSDKMIKLNIDVGEFYNFIKNEEYFLQNNRQETIRIMFRQAIEEDMPCLLKKDWFFSHSDENTKYILSDNPFVLIQPIGHNSNIGYGIDTQGVKKIIPLTSKLCLIIGDDGQYFEHAIDENTVRITNNCQAKDSDRFIFSSDKKLLEEIVSITNIDKWIKQDRIKVN